MPLSPFFASVVIKNQRERGMDAFVVFFSFHAFSEVNIIVELVFFLFYWWVGCNPLFFGW